MLLHAWDNPPAGESPGWASCSDNRNLRIFLKARTARDAAQALGITQEAWVRQLLQAGLKEGT